MGLLGDLTNVGFDSVQAKILATAISGSGGGATWGNIVGSLSNQTDLQNALNGKQDVIDANNKLDYSLLSNTPTIPAAANNGTITFQQNNSTISGNNSWSANSSSNVTINYPCDASHFIVNANMIPNSNNAYDLGDNSHKFRNVFANGYVTAARIGRSKTYGNHTVATDFYVTTNKSNSIYDIQWTFQGDGFYPTDNSTSNTAYTVGLSSASHKLSSVWSSAYSGASDEYLKENITPLEGGLDELNQLRPVEFDWKDTKKHACGFIAQEVEHVFEKAVCFPPDTKEKDGIYCLDLTALITLAIKSIQELSDKVINLEQELKTIIGDNYGN